MNSGLTFHQQQGHTETGPWFKILSVIPEKRGIDLATLGLTVQCVSVFRLTEFPDMTIAVYHDSKAT